MITYTHMCMNCGPQHPDGVTGAPTTIVDGRCERCGSEALAPIYGREVAITDDAARLAALEAFHEEIMREKNILIVVLRAREKDILAALAGYRALHPKCVGAKRCRRCKGADEFLGRGE